MVALCPLFLNELEFGVSVFVEGGKLENPDRSPRKDENQQQTQPTCDTRSGIKPRRQRWEANGGTTIIIHLKMYLYMYVLLIIDLLLWKVWKFVVASIVIFKGITRIF